MKYLLFICLLFNVTAQAQEKIQWPKNKKAAIVLSYDDALVSQLDNAVPQLEAAGLKATFFVTGDMNSETIDRWKALAKKGYEMGNHTLFHPCLSTDDNPVPSETYTPYSMIREIEVMNHFLYALDSKVVRTYAYPCAETLAGGKDYVDTLRKYNLVNYARVGGDSSSIVTDFKHVDVLQVPSFAVNDSTTASELVNYVKAVQKSGGMGVIMMHGIGGDYITISAKIHQQLIDYLKANKNNIWITTFYQAMEYATGRSEGKTQ